MKKNHAGRCSALDNIKNAMVPDALLPNRVFRGKWAAYVFCESDRIFCPEFSDAIVELMRIENSSVCSLVNLDKSCDPGCDGISSIFIDASTSRDRYWEAMCAGGPEDGWLYRMDRYVCASDIGSWCLYCEKENDVAILAFQNAEDVKRYSPATRKLWAWPIEDLIEGGSSPLFPFDRLVPAWKNSLLENYGTKSN